MSKSKTGPRAAHKAGRSPVAAPHDGADPVHTEREDHPWAINIPDHAARAETAGYARSRAAMNRVARTVPDFLYGSPPYQDHHGGGLWLKDGDTWFMVRNLAGLEWSSQFCADPAKVDLLRRNAQRLYARFPEAAKELGIEDLLAREIKTADDVAAWTDSICNASVPLPPAKHTGVLPQGGGAHHYPAPIEEIDFFKRADFNLWVQDAEGQPAAVLPVAPRGSGVSEVRVAYSTPGTVLSNRHRQAQLARQPMLLPGDSDLARQAFERQNGEPAPEGRRVPRRRARGARRAPTAGG
ncbi:MAG: DUF6424 family protein [Candidatus Dormibacteria bacterium]